jgi:hypothetical protein
VRRNEQVVTYGSDAVADPTDYFDARGVDGQWFGQFDERTGVFYLLADIAGLTYGELDWLGLGPKRGKRNANR